MSILIMSVLKDGDRSWRTTLETSPHRALEVYARDGLGTPVGWLTQAQWTEAGRQSRPAHDLAVWLGQVVSKSEDGKYVAHVPNVSVLTTSGSTPKEVDPNADMLNRDRDGRPPLSMVWDETPFDPFKDFVVTGSRVLQPYTYGGEFGQFASPDLKPTAHLVDPNHATAAERSRS